MRDYLRSGLRSRWSRLRPSSWIAAADELVVPTAVQHRFESLPAFLRVQILAALTGVVASVVLLGYLPETQLAFYALMGVSLAAYLLARGEEIVGSLLDYLTSRGIFWRWAFVAWAIISLLWTTRSPLSVERAVTLVEIQVVGLVFFDAARNLGLSGWILKSVFVSTLLATVQALIFDDVSIVQRMAGPYSSPNTLGMFCVMGLAIFIAAAPERRRPWGSAAWYVAALILLAGIFGSASVKGLLGLLLLCGLGLGFSVTRRRTASFMSIAAGTVAILVASIEPLRHVWDYALNRAKMVTIGQSVGINQSPVERSRFIKEGLQLIGHRPVFGRGLETFRWLSNEETYAHNNIVEVGVALGLIGVVLFYGLHVFVLGGTWRQRRTDDFVWRFIAIAVPTLLLFDFAVVSYYIKLFTLLMMMCVGWLERTRVAGRQTQLNGGGR